MKLSEAIRLGSMLGPQIAGQTFKRDGSCAIGSAYRAIGISRPEYSAIGDYFPIAYQTATNPVDGNRHVVFGIIRELNDEREWTREQIADWVESIEREQDAKTAPQPVDVPVER